MPNATDKDKIRLFVESAVSFADKTMNIDNRGSGVIKAWENVINNATIKNDRDILKKLVIPKFKKLLKKTKTVRKDVEKLYAEGVDYKKLAAYRDSKAFAKKTKKLISSSMKFWNDWQQIDSALMGVSGSGGLDSKKGGLYPGQEDSNVGGLINYIGMMAEYHKDTKTYLAAL